MGICLRSQRAAEFTHASGPKGGFIATKIDIQDELAVIAERLDNVPENMSTVGRRMLGVMLISRLNRIQKQADKDGTDLTAEKELRQRVIDGLLDGQVF